MGRRSLLAVLFVCGCTRGLVGAPVGTLEGVTVPLVSSPAPRTQVHGQFHGRPALVQLDPGAGMSFVTSGCSPSALGTAVKASDPFGPDETFQLASVDGLEVGGVRLRAFAPGLIEGAGCVVVLGDDVLKSLALEVDVGARTVTFRKSASAEAWLATMPPGDEVQAVSLTRDPRHDWPLLAVQVTQGKTKATSAVLFSAREQRTRLFEAPARAAGLRPGLELLQGLPVPEGVTLPKELEKVRGFAVDAVELAPGFGVAGLMVDLEAGSPPHVPVGVLGSDVWGRFNAIIDVSAGVVVLHRPRVLVSGSRAQCDRGGVVGEEGCFELHSRPVDGGVDVSLVVWRALPAGAHLTLDVTGADGAPCRVGLTFSATDRGRSTAHLLPWGRLRSVMPACGAALAGATSASPALLEEGALPGCPGTCAWAVEQPTGRLTCECQPTHPALDESSEQALLELYKRLLEKKVTPREAEPADP